MFSVVIMSVFFMAMVAGTLASTGVEKVSGMTCVSGYCLPEGYEKMEKPYGKTTVTVKVEQN